MGSFEQVQERREDLLPEGIQQKGGAPVLTRASNRTDEMPEDAARQLRRKEYRRTTRVGSLRAPESAASAALGERGGRPRPVRVSSERGLRTIVYQ